MKKHQNKRFISSAVLLIIIVVFIGYMFAQKLIHIPLTTVSSVYNGDHYKKIEISTDSLSGLVAYTANIHDMPQIFLKNLDTDEVKQLTFSGDNHFVKFSPNGQQIIFLLYTKENADDIYIMDVDGSNKQPLIATSADESFPSWSPDGTKIAFSSDEGGNSQIYVIDINSKKTTKITNTDTFASMPAWSSDGKQIAFLSADGGNATRTQLFVINSDGSNLIQMTDYHINTWDGAPVWCPDNSCLVFSRDTGKRNIMLLDIESKSITPLFVDTFDSKELLVLRQSASMRYITFVVDGEYFAFDIRKQKVYPLNLGYISSLSLYP